MSDADPLIRAKRKKKADGLFGQIAIKLNIVTRAQLDEALELQRYAKEDKPLGVIIMDLGYVKKEDLERIIQAQKAMVAEVGNRQKKVREDALFGKVSIRLGFCTEDQLMDCVEYQEQLPPERFMRLGDILVIKGFLSIQQIKRVLDAQKGLIVYCPTCNTRFNTVMLMPGTSIPCHGCDGRIRVPERKREGRMDEAVYFGSD